MTIHFGTDGWRAVISDTFTFTNLRQVTQAISDAIASGQWINGFTLEEPADPNKMIVGFDTRFLSDRYAQEAARVWQPTVLKSILPRQTLPLPPSLTLSATVMPLAGS